jgi:hypothetical protein
MYWGYCSHLLPKMQLSPGLTGRKTATAKCKLLDCTLPFDSRIGTMIKKSMTAMHIGISLV